MSGTSRYWAVSDVRIHPSTDETDDKYASTQVNDLLWDKLKDINAHDYDAIDSHKKEIFDKLATEYEEVEDVHFGGSHSRSTDVTGLSDVDILVTLGDFKNEESSSQMIRQFARSLKDRFPGTEIELGRMAVTLKFSDGIEVQVLPAFRYRDGYRIPDPRSQGWIKTFPKRFARQMTEVNSKNSKLVVPTVKLARDICRAKNINVESYHLENMAVNAFNQYTGKKTLPRMLEHLFGKSKSMCLSPIRDPSGQSKYVDEGLSSSARHQLARDFRSVEREIQSAMRSRSLTSWGDLFND